MKKKLFTLFFTLIASVGTIFASDTQVNGIWYDFDSSNKTATVTYRGGRYSSYSNEYTGSIVIPSSVIYNNVTYIVTSIGGCAFSGCTSLTSITIPNSVTSIEDYVFENCSSLTSVTIPNSVTSIGKRAFYNCSGLTSITIPNSVTTIGNYAFFVCSGLTSVTIPNSVTSIDEGVFCKCSGLASVTIPNSVTSIGGSAFSGCTGLTSIIIPNSITSIGNYAFQGCSGLTSITIPNSVTSIGVCAFSGCSGLTSVTIPNSVTSIGEGAFYNVWNIIYNGTATGSPWGARIFNGYVDEPFVFEDETKTILLVCSKSAKGDIAIPNSVASIGERAFYNCSGLTSITIPNSVTTIGDYAFYGCSSLTSVTLNSNYIVGKTYTSDSNINSIFGTQVTEYIIGDDVTTIGNYAFYGCTGLTNMEIPNNVTSIGNNAFYGCSNITSVIWNAKNCNSWNFGSQVETFMFGDSVEVIPANLCNGMNKPTKLVFPTSLKSIGEYAFKGWTKIKQINVPNEVETIGTHAFDSCIFVTSIYLGNAVSEIGDYAFKGCIRVNDITSMNTVTPVVYNNTLTSISRYAYLYVQAGSKRTYQLDPYWSRFDIKEIESEDTTLTQDKVTVEANEDNAVFTWPVDDNAATYSLKITKDSVVFCVLTFNANGQLVDIAFAPGRNGQAHAPAATTSLVGMSFTVTGLNGASKYAYRLAASDAQNNELVVYCGEFATIGYEGEITPGGEPERPEGLENVSAMYGESTKVLRNDQILILRGDKTYTLTGQEVK